jgi:hypothetical protein
LHNYIKGFKNLYKTLSKIRDDTTNYKKEVNGILEVIMDKKHLIIPIYLWDFTQAFKVWSLALQKYGALLVDQYGAYEAL